MISPSVSGDPPQFGDARVPAATWELIEPDRSGCWLWRGTFSSSGYGMTSVRLSKNKPQYAHRLMFQLLVGDIGEGLELDHLCRVPACVNPAHLEPVTHHENVMRSPVAPAAINARKTHCKNGHPFGTESKPGHGRVCRVCKREYERAWQSKRPGYRTAYKVAWMREKRARERAARAAVREGEPRLTKTPPAGE